MEQDKWKTSAQLWQNLDEETIRALWNVQGQLNKLEEERDKAIEEIERQFLESSRPLYEERQRICSLVDRFWFHVLCSHPYTGTKMTNKDRTVLQHLEDVFFTEIENCMQGYQINLKFSPNDYIEDEIIWKQVKYVDDLQGWKGAASGIRWKRQDSIIDPDNEFFSDGEEVLQLTEKGNTVAKLQRKARSLLSWFETEDVTDNLKDRQCID
ncbi:NAP1-related protein 1 [Galdieria sulphuraria]|nr:NAP1-related protein 1 [Galdieria sulphuraria]